MNLILKTTTALKVQWIERLASLAGATVDNLPSFDQPQIIRFSQVQMTPELRRIVEADCLKACVDYAFMPVGARLSDYKLLVMDMDSTLINIECIDEMADLCGCKAQVAAITEAAMRGGISDFSQSLRRRVALLAGCDARVLQRVYDERLQLSPGTQALLQAAQAAGLKTLLVSGGFSFFSERLKARLNLDYAYANTIAIDQNRFTGEVVGTIIDATVKANKLRETCHQLGIEPGQTIVIGDGANDLEMMRSGGMSVAYHAKPIVRAQTSHAINFGGLDTLLAWF